MCRGWAQIHPQTTRSPGNSGCHTGRKSPLTTPQLFPREVRARRDRGDITGLTERSGRRRQRAGACPRGRDPREHTRPYASGRPARRSRTRPLARTNPRPHAIEAAGDERPPLPTRHAADRGRAEAPRRMRAAAPRIAGGDVCRAPARVVVRCGAPAFESPKLSRSTSAIRAWLAGADHPQSDDFGWHRTESCIRRRRWVYTCSTT